MGVEIYECIMRRYVFAVQPLRAEVVGGPLLRSPIINSQIWNQFEIGEISGDQYSAVCNCDGSDFQVHCADANFLGFEVVKNVRGRFSKI